MWKNRSEEIQKLSRQILDSKAYKIRIILWDTMDDTKLIIEIGEFYTKPTKGYMNPKIAKGKALALWLIKWINGLFDHAEYCENPSIVIEEVNEP